MTRSNVAKLESLGVLAGGIAHDFNTLLVGIMGNASLALPELPPGTEGRGWIAQIETAARRASDLARQMLAYPARAASSSPRSTCRSLSAR